MPAACRPPRGQSRPARLLRTSGGVIGQLQPPAVDRPRVYLSPRSVVGCRRCTRRPASRSPTGLSTPVARGPTRRWWGASTPERRRPSGQGAVRAGRRGCGPRSPAACGHGRHAGAGLRGGCAAVYHALAGSGRPCSCGSQRRVRKAARGRHGNFLDQPALNEGSNERGVHYWRISKRVPGRKPRFRSPNEWHPTTSPGADIGIPSPTLDAGLSARPASSTPG